MPAIFGEQVWYKRKFGLAAAKERSLEPTWSEGVWLGMVPRSNLSIVGNKGGVRTVWAVRRKVKERRWAVNPGKEVKMKPKTFHTKVATRKRTEE